MDKISFPVSIVAQTYPYSTSFGTTNFSPKISKVQSLLIKRIRWIYPGTIANLSGSLKEAGKSLISPEHFWLGVRPPKVL
jgi:hypothetical protein